MRKNVLFIAKFNNILKGMNTILARSFNMQMCPPEPPMVEKTLDVMETDLVLFYISGLSDLQLSNLCAKLEPVSLAAPVIVFGAEEECKRFDRFGLNVAAFLHRPVGTQEISQTISTLLDVDLEAEPPEPEPPAEEPAVQPGMSLADFADSLETDARRCILLVDDDGRILRAMKLLLEKTYRVNLANSGLSALESIERERPDAVLLDYEMPVLDGRDTLELIRKNRQTQDLPVFFLTGVADRGRIANVIHLKPQGYLLKSSEQSVILGALDRFFSGAES